ncbi:hypothetical protein ANN_27129 [Periplaneta americana]|uniref:Uncharacterized protein n=1 Tax=Periplaneta americana TaxID=6978 RepID=A0ABQ8RXQ7_PERAM|nr:hypothetical protein ANN_27129 [Periplaneta americana]
MVNNSAKISRRVNSAQIEQNKDEVSRAMQLLAEGQINDALLTANNLLQNASIPVRNRRAQSWFNKQCYDSRKETIQALWRSRVYAYKRSLYKQLLGESRVAYIETEAKRIAEEAKTDSFLALRKRNQVKANGIPIGNWEKHFQEILNDQKKEEAFPIVMPEIPSENKIRIAPEEIRDIILRAMKRKATGPDNIYIEHIKVSIEPLIPFWTELFNKCDQTGRILMIGE